MNCIMLAGSNAGSAAYALALVNLDYFSSFQGSNRTSLYAAVAGSLARTGSALAVLPAAFLVVNFDGHIIDIFLPV